ncbi:MAG: hypothetical protein JWO38_6853 [Gemmataceae bacterium]|nr:hypothetical protein [Gemmataceae bacterium]
MLPVDRVVLINLKRRPDRLAAFRLCQQEKGWALPDPIVFDAVDGNKVGVPRYYVSGGGAWGCCRSHISIIERAVMDDVCTLLVLEDDITWKPDAWDHLAAFAAAVPADWDQLMLGGQHIGQQGAPVEKGVVRCTNCQRTHAYAIRGPAMRDLLTLWYGCNVHIDHQMGPWQRNWKVYAPDPFIFGQARGQSDINGRHNPTKFWATPSGEQPVVHLTAPPAVARALRGRGLHMGYDRDPTTDYDKGLVTVAQHRDKVGALRRWLGTIVWEAWQEENLIACVWHPDVTAETVKAAHAGPVVEIRGDTVEACLAQVPVGAALRSNFVGTHVVVLRSSREVMEALRGHGWHSGYWRDDVTGHDNGLRQIVAAKQGRAEKLAAWVEALGREAEVIPGGLVCLWHDQIATEEVRSAAAERKVVEVTAETVEDAVRRFRETAG